MGELWGDRTSARSVRRGQLNLSFHPFQGGVHLFEHLLGCNAELPQLASELLHRELGLEIFRQLESLHEDAIATHELLHRLDEFLFALAIKFAVLTAQLHQLLVVAKQALGLVLDDVGIEEGHRFEMSFFNGNSADFLWSLAVRVHPMDTIPEVTIISPSEPHRANTTHA